MININIQAIEQEAIRATQEYFNGLGFTVDANAILLTIRERNPQRDLNNIKKQIADSWAMGAIDELICKHKQYYDNCTGQIKDIESQRLCKKHTKKVEVEAYQKDYSDLWYLRELHKEIIASLNRSQVKPANPTGSKVVLTHADYLKIFIRALQYDSIEKIEAYFEGKFNEHKESNPLPLFIDGLQKAYKYLIDTIEKAYIRDWHEYHLAIAYDKENKEQYVKPIKENYLLPVINIDSEFTGSYNLPSILAIRQGLEQFIVITKPTAKPDPLLNTELFEVVALAKIKSFDNPTALNDELRQVYNSEFEPYKNLLAAKLGYKSPINQFGINKELANSDEFKKRADYTPAVAKRVKEQKEPTQEMPLTDAMIKDFIEQQKAKFSDLLSHKDSLHRLRARTYIDYLESRLKPNESQPKPTFTPETDTLNDWLKPDYIKPFIEIEQGLFDRGFIDANYKWQKGKTQKDLIDLLTILVDCRLFKEIVKGKRKQLFHYRQFISERYGYGKTGLTETSKKYKPSIEIARASFMWVKTPA